ncbi:MAG: glutathione S-transferase family protein [Gammaproteobacteria bacterium]|nr:glutathione S-transferase family protein [Gammaproteobacteria bacterium]
MGLLVDGVWHDQWYDTRASGGRFIRSEAQFRHWITPDGAAGPTGEGGFAAERGRYHLYVGLACPWAHRTLIFRHLKGLTEHISLSVVHWYMAEHGWTFEPGEGVAGDPIHRARFLHEVYTAAQPGYSGRVTIPVLWDKHRGVIVNNESSEIIRMLNSAFDECGAAAGDYYPQALRADIDAVNARVYETVNNGVYRAGFATSQAAYDEAVLSLFETLDWLEARLEGQRYLCADQLTEADWRLFTTLIRFDAVYHFHFKCNLKRIRDYPRLHALMMRLYELPGIAETVNLEHIKGHYFASHKTINPTGIIPRGPLTPF